MSDLARRGLLRAEYTARINRVQDHIERNLDADLRLADLAAVANFSAYHFHRVFRALVGETVAEFTQRLRLQAAAGMLVKQPGVTVTEVALRCGYASSATFARAFKERFGVSATTWRDRGGAERSKSGKADRKAGRTVSNAGNAAGLRRDYPEGVRKTPDRRSAMAKLDYSVEVRELPELTVAYIRHTGSFGGIGAAFERLMRWAGARGLVRFPETRMLAVYHDDPEVTDPEKLRSSACVSVPAGTPVDGQVGSMTVPGGRFAVAHFEIQPTQFGEAWNALMRDWLPESGYQPDDRMCYELYLNDPSRHPEGKFIAAGLDPMVRGGAVPGEAR